MLILSRAKEQVVWIGDDIKIVVVEIRGDKVRLGIEAPKNIAVHREEVYVKIRDAKEAVALQAMDQQRT